MKTKTKRRTSRRRPRTARGSPTRRALEAEPREIDAGEAASEEEDSPAEFDALDDELQERGMHIIEPLEEKEEQGFKTAGGARRGEPMRLVEEEDDFEDGRSSGGTYSRLENDRWGRGETASERSADRAGVASVDAGDSDASRSPVAPYYDVSPDEKGVLVTEEMRRPARRRGRGRPSRTARGARRGARSRRRAG